MHVFFSDPIIPFLSIISLLCIIACFFQRSYYTFSIYHLIVMYYCMFFSAILLYLFYLSSHCCVLLHVFFSDPIIPFLSIISLMCIIACFFQRSYYTLSIHHLIDVYYRMFFSAILLYLFYPSSHWCVLSHVFFSDPIIPFLSIISLLCIIACFFQRSYYTFSIYHLIVVYYCMFFSAILLYLFYLSSHCYVLLHVFFSDPIIPFLSIISLLCIIACFFQRSYYTFSIHHLIDVYYCMFFSAILLYLIYPSSYWCVLSHVFFSDPIILFLSIISLMCIIACFFQRSYYTFSIHHLIDVYYRMFFSAILLYLFYPSSHWCVLPHVFFRLMTEWSGELSWGRDSLWWDEQHR